jgi:aromatic ring-opening dioxygenase catalytic subunit (LigB family)
MSVRLPALFLPHGGGPCFFMDPPAGHPHLWDKMAAHLRGIPASLPEQPKAVMVVSGHWETTVPTVQDAARHSLLFDYYGFPEHTYRLQYPAPGSPAIPARILELLREAGVSADADSERGLDHGVFVPFKLIYPDAEVPIVQLSLESSLDPAAHLRIGQALAPLRDEGVLIAASGMSFHNLRMFFTDDPRTSNRLQGRASKPAEDFDAWLNDAATDAPRRTEKLTHWRDAPGATFCHPRAEHLLPMMVAAGAAEGERGIRTYNERLLGKPISGFRFGD